METKGDLPIIPFKTTKALETWFRKNHETSKGLWIKFAKKANPAPSVTYAEALDVALCYGWIDGQKYTYDADWYLHRYTARRAKSPWSQINRDHVARLESEGRMHPAGLAAVEAAKADGRWDAAYASPSKIKVPADLAAAFAENPAARKAFDSLKSAERFSILCRVTTVKKAETRERKIREYVEMLSASPEKSADILDGWPKGMSRPSIRALHAAGYMQLEDLRGVDLENLKDLHGMGPKGLQVLKETLTA